MEMSADTTQSQASVSNFTFIPLLYPVMGESVILYFVVAVGALVLMKTVLTSCAGRTFDIRFSLMFGLYVLSCFCMLINGSLFVKPS